MSKDRLICLFFIACAGCGDSTQAQVLSSLQETIAIPKTDYVDSVYVAGDFDGRFHVLRRPFEGDPSDYSVMRFETRLPSIGETNIGRVQGVARFATRAREPLLVYGELFGSLASWRPSLTNTATEGIEVGLEHHLGDVVPFDNNVLVAMSTGREQIQEELRVDVWEGVVGSSTFARTEIVVDQTPYYPSAFALGSDRWVLFQRAPTTRSTTISLVRYDPASGDHLEEIEALVCPHPEAEYATLAQYDALIADRSIAMVVDCAETSLVIVTPGAAPIVVPLGDYVVGEIDPESVRPEGRQSSIAWDGDRLAVVRWPWGAPKGTVQWFDLEGNAHGELTLETPGRGVFALDIAASGQTFGVIHAQFAETGLEQTAYFTRFAARGLEP